MRTRREENVFSPKSQPIQQLFIQTNLIRSTFQLCYIACGRFQGKSHSIFIERKKERGGREEKREKYSYSRFQSKRENPLGSQPIAMGEIFLPDLFLAVSSTSCIIVLLMACTVAREKPIISFLSGGNLIFLCTVTNGLITTIFFSRHHSILNISESVQCI